MPEEQTDLQELGQILRDRREALGWSREELASRMPHSAAYIFLIEGSRPRRGGSPSRPRRHTLIDWAAALGMSETETNRLLALAHHEPLHFSQDRRLSVPRTSWTDSPRDRVIGQVHEVLTMAEQADTLVEVAAELRSILDGITVRLERELEKRDGHDSQALTRQLNAVLNRARQTPHWNAITTQVNDVLCSAMIQLQMSDGDGEPS